MSPKNVKEIFKYRVSQHPQHASGMTNMKAVSAGAQAPQTHGTITYAGRSQAKPQTQLGSNVSELHLQMQRESAAPLQTHQSSNSAGLRESSHG